MQCAGSLKQRSAAADNEPAEDAKHRAPGNVTASSSLTFPVTCCHEVIAPEWFWNKIRTSLYQEGKSCFKDIMQHPRYFYNTLAPERHKSLWEYHGNIRAISWVENSTTKYHMFIKSKTTSPNRHMDNIVLRVNTWDAKPQCSIEPNANVSEYHSHVRGHTDTQSSSGTRYSHHMFPKEPPGSD